MIQSRIQLFPNSKSRNRKSYSISGNFPVSDKQDLKYQEVINLQKDLGNREFNGLMESILLQTGRKVNKRVDKCEQKLNRSTEVKEDTRSYDPVVHHFQVGSKIQASPVNTYYGTFDDDYYEVIRSGRMPIGLQMVLSFLPGEQVDSSKIGLLQIARTVRNGQPYFKSQGRETQSSRAISSEEAQPFDSQILATDEGFGIDRFPHHRNPLYVIGEGRGFSEHNTLGEGASEGPIRQLTPERIEELRSEYPGITSGAMYTGYGRHGSRQGINDRPVSARMQDTPMTLPTPNSEQLFETTALAVEGRQAGRYYGSVQWGWRINSSGHFTKLPLTLKSQGAPSSTFLEAAQLWNQGQNSGGLPNIPIPVPEVHVIRVDDLAFYRGPHDNILEIGPLGFLLRGTRIEMMSGTDSLTAQIRVVDCPPVQGYVESGDLSSGSARSSVERGLPVYAGPHDNILEISPIAILQSGQPFRILNSDGFVTRITADSCAFMGEVGYIDNTISSNFDERPQPARRGANSTLPSTHAEIQRNSYHKQLPIIQRTPSEAREAQSSITNSTNVPYNSDRGIPYTRPILPEHVLQGGLADCYLVATLLSLSYNPNGRAWIRDSVRELERNRYLVRLFTRNEDSVPRELWVQVGPILSSHLGAREMSGGAPDDSHWVQAMELAYARVRGGGRIVNIGRPGVGGREIGGARTALRDITGLNATRYRITSGANRDELWDRMRGAHEDGLILVAGTGSNQNPSMGIYSGHNYGIPELRERSGNRLVTIHNPWGHRFRRVDLSAGANNSPIFNITFDQFVNYFIQLDIGSAPPDPDAE